MPITNDPEVARDTLARRQPPQQPKPEDINSDWLDDMVRRLFNELDRQMKQVEDSRTPCTDALAEATPRGKHAAGLSQ